MDLALTESQQLLKNSVRSFMEREASKSVLVGLQGSETGLAPGWWETAAKLGWLGMMIAPEYGGVGSTFTDAAVLFEELGRGPLPGPFFSSAILGALLVQEAGTTQQNAEILPAVAEGRTILTLALNDPRTSMGPQSVTMRAEQRNGILALNGEKPFVSDLMAATHVLVAVRTGDAAEDVSLIVVDTSLPGVSRRSLPGFLSWQGALTLENVLVPDSQLLGEGGSGGWSSIESALERAWPILSSYQVGGCQAVLDMTVAYTGERIQFSVPIGRLQRVQDHVIRMVNYLDGARWSTYEALWKLDSGRPARSSAHLSQALASEAYLEVCNAGHEVHAGVGSSNDYGLVKHTRMSRTLLTFLGDPTWHKRRMADALAW